MNNSNNNNTKIENNNNSKIENNINLYQKYKIIETFTKYGGDTKKCSEILSNIPISNVYNI